MVKAMNISDFSSSIIKLKNKQINLEKCESESLKYIKANCDIAIEDEYNHLISFSDQEFDKIRTDMQENFKLLQNIKSKILIDNVEKIDLPTLRNTMLSFQNNIQNIKDKINPELENLTKNENALNIDIINIEIKLADMDKKMTDVNKISSQLPKNILDDDHIYQEVKDYTIFLTKSGGHEGGWSEDDHMMFVKMYNKYKQKEKIAAQIHKLLPDKTNEDIVSHIEWYETYLELKYKQKEAIEKWKGCKNKKEDKQEDNSLNEKCNKKKISEERPEEKLEVKEKLKQWKLEKEQKLQQFLQWQMQNSTKTKEYEKQKRIKQLEKKKQIEKWKSTKTVKDRADTLEKEIHSLREKERRTSLANKLIREFQSQDNFYISRRLSKLRVSVTMPSIPRNLKNQQFKVPRDPERIFKATQQWVNRITPEEFVSTDTIFARNVSVKRIPKLAIPDWRRIMPQN